MVDWTDEELRSAVRAYLEMLNAQDSGASYSKAQIRHRLLGGPLKARSEPSIEFRMRNITAVMEAHDHPTVKGYLAAANAGEAISTKIWNIVCEMAKPKPIGSKTSSRPPIIYFNIGWMQKYAGPAPDDRTIGAHGYLSDHPHGAECYNFLPTKYGTVLGYRPPGGRENTNIARMGGASNANEIEGALVVWLAKEPGSGRTLIVGWYQNATVFRKPRDRGIDLNGDRIFYSAETEVGDATLLQPIARTFEVRSSRLLPGAGFGQKPTWYGAEAIDQQVWAYIQSKTKTPSPKKPASKNAPPKNLDPELRLKAERAAVEHAWAYYKSEYGGSCFIESVESAAKGWDLEVHNGSEPLLVEVKGLSNAVLICELTPNEYEKMMLPANSSRYVVYVVNNALAVRPAMPIASIFEHVSDGTWRTADGRKLIIKEKTAAVLSCG